MAQPNMFEEIISTLSMGKQINQKVNVFDRIDYFKVKWERHISQYPCEGCSK